MSATEQLAAIDVFLEADRNVRKTRDLTRHEKRVERAMRAGWQAQGAEFSRRISRRRHHFAEAIPRQDWEDDFDGAVAPTVKPMADAIQRAAERAVLLGWRTAVSDLQRDDSYDASDGAAYAFLQSRGAERVRGINDTTRQQLASLLAQAEAEGWSYKRTAAAISDRFRGFRVGAPGKRSRAELVAITEAGEAYEHGRLMFRERLAMLGISSEKRWITVGDGAVCSICAPNGGAGWIPSDAAFPSGHERPLGHPACRCDMSLRAA